MLTINPINRSALMHDAWTRYRASGHMTFGTCLRLAWADAKRTSKVYSGSVKCTIGRSAITVDLGGGKFGGVYGDTYAVRTELRKGYGLTWDAARKVWTGTDEQLQVICRRCAVETAPAPAPAVKVAAPAAPKQADTLVSVTVWGWEAHTVVINSSEPIEAQAQHWADGMVNNDPDVTATVIIAAYNEELQRRERKARAATAPATPKHQHNDGLCPHCGTWCYGDCQAN